MCEEALNQHGGRLSRYQTFNGSAQGDYLSVQPLKGEAGYTGVYHLWNRQTGGYIWFYQTGAQATQAEAAELVERIFPLMPKVNREYLDNFCPDGKEAGHA